MPFGDGRGPAGMGPMTGRAAGYCAGYTVPGYMYPQPPRGFQGTGFGSGGGRGHRRWFRATGLTGWQRSGYGDPCMRPSRFSGVYDLPYSAPYGFGPHTRKDQLSDLKQHAATLEEMLHEIRKRIDALETVPEAE